MIPCRNTPSHSRLEAAPPEIVDIIASHVDPQDLKQLRLASFYLNKATEDQFISTHFTERAFLCCSEESMDILVEISKDKRYGKKLRSIILCVDAFEYPPAHYRPDDSLVHRYDRWNTGMYFYISTLLNDKLLVALVNLKQHNKGKFDVQLTTTATAVRDGHPPAGYRLYQDQSMSLQWMQYIDLKGLMVLLIVADVVTHSDTTINKFSIHTGMKYNTGWVPMLTQWMDYTTPPQSTTTNPFFVHVRKLFWTFGEEDLFSDDWDPTLYDGFIAYLAGFSNLTELSLERACRGWPSVVEECPEIEAFGSALLKTDFPTVKTLTLSGLLFQSPQLFAFLRRQTSLEKLSIQNCCLTYADEFLDMYWKVRPSRLMCIERKVLTQMITFKHPTFSFKVCVMNCRVIVDGQFDLFGLDGVIIGHDSLDESDPDDDDGEEQKDKNAEGDKQGERGGQCPCGGHCW